MKPETEAVNPRSRDIDLKNIQEILHIINEEDKSVAAAVAAVLPEAAALVELIVEKFAGGGRLIYIGAGTSGRIGVLDAAECPPTYGIAQNRIVAVMAGGANAVFNAAETAEDSEAGGKTALAELDVSARDVVVGLSASGRTPFVAGGLFFARERGAATAVVVCNKTSCLAEYADIAIKLLTGPEVISGSTRMKAATAQKMFVNMVSTAAMIKLGKVTGNFMTCMRPGNSKLLERAKFIIHNITGVPLREAEVSLRENDGNIRQTVNMLRNKKAGSVKAGNRDL